MITSKNNSLERKNKKSIVWDAFYEPTSQKAPLVIFCHGYKGFKDWGAWDLVAQAFSKANFFFVKFNFSHNGGTLEQPIDFPDLETFAENNYTKELEDLDDMINYLISDKNHLSKFIDQNKIILIGHSRGGGIVTIKSSEDSRISKVITWAGVCDFEKRTATIGDLKEWKETGVKHVLNGRTKQLMPHNYQFYKDFIANKNRLDIKNATRNIKIPHLIIHAKDDPAVKFEEAKTLHSWNKKSVLMSIENSDHVFGAMHPWYKETLPKALKEVVAFTINFIKKDDHISL